MAVTLDKEPDFGGWATKADLECADGLIIGADAFKHMDGIKVPLVYQHGGNDIDNVLGYAILEHRAGAGVYAHGFFNNSDRGKQGKEAVRHGDIDSLSIFADRIRRQGNLVRHGQIVEVSLVMAGANPGAKIDFVSFQHADGSPDEESYGSCAFIFAGETIEHADESSDGDKTEEGEAEKGFDPDAIWQSMTEDQQELAKQMIRVAKSSDEDDEDDDEDEKDDEAEASTEDSEKAKDSESTDSDEKDDSDKPDDSDEKDEEDEKDKKSSESTKHSATNTNSDLEGTTMTETITHNVFDQDAVIQHNLTGRAKDNQYILSDKDKKAIFHSALQQRSSSLKDVVEGFKLQHGIDKVEIMFPDAKAVSNVPEWVSRRTEWVDKVIKGARKTPFSRIKSLAADLTLDRARAKGYIKGNMKKEEFFSVSKRVTTPQTVYKKQKLDRDDILDITDFDVVVWLKGEMRLMLDEEVARAVLIGDGRSNADDDKILEDHIRPIATDHELFQTTIQVPAPASATSAGEEIVDAVILSRRHYRGSGNPTFFTQEITLSQMLNAKDELGRRIYRDISELASVLRCSSIVPVEVMEEEEDLLGVMVNMADYTIGSDRGGDVSLFDQFDIDYNQYKYLIEVRCSGALTKPKSALVFRRADAGMTVVRDFEAPSFDSATGQVTIPAEVDSVGVVFKNQNTGAVLTKGQQIQLDEDQTLVVIAVPAAGSYFDPTLTTTWDFYFDQV